MLLCSLLVVGVFSFVCGAVRPSPVFLPGAPSVNFSLYSGYVTVDAASNRNLFYFFAESQRASRASDPVLMWQTGGPGCSSLLAMMSENGPFRPNASNPLQLFLDDYAWNREANVIWLESPAGVGFSFSKNPDDYNVGDARTAQDTYTFLQKFFTDLFPEYRQNKLFLTGESYGGHYVPNSAARILQGNRNNEGVPINLKGIFEGNAWTDMPLDNLGALNTWVERAIVPRNLVDAVKQTCNLSYVGPLHKLKRDAVCDNAITAAMASFSSVDIYNIYVDVCLGGNKLELKMLRQMAKVSWFHSAMYENIVAHRASRRDLPLPPFDACVDNHLTAYWNNLDVQIAVNAVPPGTKTPIAWQECSSVVNYDFNSVATSMLPVLQQLMDEPGFHVHVYSGDVDAIVPVSGTLLWIESLNRTVLSPWSVWLDQDNQAGGFTTVYDGFTFSTVRNAGHMVPFYQPARGFQLLSTYLANASK